MEPKRSRPRILLTGKDGQVGFALQSSLAQRGAVIAVGRQECDLTQPSAIRDLVAAVRPDIIINPAAYTAVDKAEAEPEIAFAVNAIAPYVFAEEAARHNSLLVHYSTDYVFDGCKTSAYTEGDRPMSQSVYGKSKLAGEEAIRKTGCRHLILRTSWVFGAHGGNFLKTVLRLASERDSLRIVDDQIGAPTAAPLIAAVTAEILRQSCQDPHLDALEKSGRLGTYHLTALGAASWHGYAQHIVHVAKQLGLPLKLQIDDIAKIATSEYPLPAPRPSNSKLNTTKLQSAFGIALPVWQAGVEHVLKQIITP